MSKSPASRGASDGVTWREAPPPSLQQLGRLPRAARAAAREGSRGRGAAARGARVARVAPEESDAGAALVSNSQVQHDTMY